MSRLTLARHFVVLSSIAFSLTSVFLASNGAKAQTANPAAVSLDKKVNPQHWITKAYLEGGRKISRTDADEQKASRTRYSATGAGIESRSERFSLGGNFKRVLRRSEDFSTRSDSEKNTVTMTPKVGARFGSGYQFGVSVGYEFIQTSVDRSNSPEDHYDLRATRAVLAASQLTDSHFLELRFTSQAIAEKEFTVYDEPMIDREYIPMQLALSWAQQLPYGWTIDSGVTYSQYNKKAYEDKYTSVMPKAPTVAEVFDNQLSFRVGAAYLITNKFEVSTSAVRKAALDTNTISGDEPVLASTGLLGIKYKATDLVAITGGAEFSNGEKTRETAAPTGAQSVRYSAKSECYQAGVTVRM